MLKLRRYLPAALLVWMFVAWVLPADAQDANSDRAKAILNKGVAQYKALNFKAAKATLLQVNSEYLSESDKTLLGEYLTKADTGIRRQAAALEAYRQAEEDLRAGNLGKAKEGFEFAAASDYLYSQSRADAEAKVAEVEAKMKLLAEQAAAEPQIIAPEPEASPIELEALAPEVETEAAATTEPTAEAAKPPIEATELPAEIAEAPVPAEATELPAEIAEAPVPAEATELPAEIAEAPVPAEATELPAEIAEAPVPAEAEQPEAAPTELLALAPEPGPEPTIAPADESLLGEAPEPVPGLEAEAPVELEVVEPSEPAVPAEDEQTRRLLEALAKRRAEAEPEDVAPPKPSPASVDADASILTRLQENLRVAKQVSDLEFDKALADSRQAIAAPLDELARESFDSAANNARIARNVLQQNKRLYSSTEYSQKLSQVEAQLVTVAETQVTWQTGKVAQQMAQIELARRERIRREQEQLARKIDTLHQRAGTLLDERDNEEALQIIRQILKLDPTDPWATDKVDLVRQLVLLQDEYELDRTQAIQEQEGRNQLRESEIPWWEPLRFPDDWVELTLRRAGEGASAITESEADARVRRVLQQSVEKLDFDDGSFENVIDYLRVLSGGLSFHVKWGALDAGGIRRDTSVTVHLQNVTLDKALRTILDDVGVINPLGYIVDGGVITISTIDDLSTLQYTQTLPYDITDLTFRVPNFIGQQMSLPGTTGGQGGGTGGGTGGTSLFGGGSGVTTGVGNQGISANDNPSKQQIIDGLITMITDNIDPNSWRPTGEIGAISQISGQLVITQTAENHRRINDLLNHLREAHTLQISIETRFIRVDTGFLESIGIDLDFFVNLGSSLNPGVVIDPATGTPINVQLPGGSWIGKPANGKWTPIGVFQGSQPFADMIGVTTPLADSIGTLLKTPALSLAGTFLDDIQVNFLIEATQAHQATRVVTAPNLTLFNGQRSNIQLSDQIQYITEFESDITVTDGVATTTVTIETEVLQSGLLLDVEGTVSADRRYVRLTLHPQLTELLGFRPVPPEAGPIELPQLRFQTIETTVSVPDGGTLLIGGLKQAAEIEREQGVPLLNKIPILQRAFTNRGKVRDEKMLLILVKPKIVWETEEEQLRFPQGS